MKHLKFAKTLCKDTSGAVAVEFALWSVLLFMVVLVSLDFGVYLLQAGRIASASEQAAVVAYNRRDEGAVNSAALEQLLNSAARVPGSAVRTKVTCNGSSGACNVAPAARQCACVSGTTPTYKSSSACGDICPSGATSGYYVTLESEYDFKPFVDANTLLEGKVIRQSVTVRFQ